MREGYFIAYYSGNKIPKDFAPANTQRRALDEGQDILILKTLVFLYNFLPDFPRWEGAVRK
jgi:hypothetical protein